MESLIKHTENCTVPADKIAVLTKEAQKMIAKIKLLEKYCSEYTKIENYEEAVKSPLKYDLHHRLEISEHKSKSDLIEENLYYNRPAEELIFLEHGEHVRLHKANLSAETRQKISEAQKGHEGYWKGKHLSTEARQKLSEAYGAPLLSPMRTIRSAGTPISLAQIP